jgi:hypothetical protein
LQCPTRATSCACTCKLVLSFHSLICIFYYF